jgi:hypothetical protein
MEHSERTHPSTMMEVFKPHSHQHHIQTHGDPVVDEITIERYQPVGELTESVCGWHVGSGVRDGGRCHLVVAVNVYTATLYTDNATEIRCHEALEESPTLHYYILPECAQKTLCWDGPLVEGARVEELLSASFLGVLCAKDREWYQTWIKSGWVPLLHSVVWLTPSDGKPRCRVTLRVGIKRERITHPFVGMWSSVDCSVHNLAERARKMERFNTAILNGRTGPTMPRSLRQLYGQSVAASTINRIQSLPEWVKMNEARAASASGCLWQRIGPIDKGTGPSYSLGLDSLLPQGVLDIRGGWVTDSGCVAPSSMTAGFADTGAGIGHTVVFCHRARMKVWTDVLPSGSSVLFWGDAVEGDTVSSATRVVADLTASPSGWCPPVEFIKTHLIPRTRWVVSTHQEASIPVFLKTALLWLSADGGYAAVGARLSRDFNEMFPDGVSEDPWACTRPIVHTLLSFYTSTVFAVQ